MLQQKQSWKNVTPALTSTPKHVLKCGDGRVTVTRPEDKWFIWFILDAGKYVDSPDPPLAAAVDHAIEQATAFRAALEAFKEADDADG